MLEGSKEDKQKLVKNSIKDMSLALKEHMKLQPKCGFLVEGSQGELSKRFKEVVQTFFTENYAIATPITEFTSLNYTSIDSKQISGEQVRML